MTKHWFDVPAVGLVTEQVLRPGVTVTVKVLRAEPPVELDGVTETLASSWGP